MLPISQFGSNRCLLPPSGENQRVDGANFQAIVQIILFQEGTIMSRESVKQRWEQIVKTLQENLERNGYDGLWRVSSWDDEGMSIFDSYRAGIEIKWRDGRRDRLDENWVPRYFAVRAECVGGKGGKPFYGIARDRDMERYRITPDNHQIGPQQRRLQDVLVNEESFRRGSPTGQSSETYSGRAWLGPVDNHGNDTVI